MKRVLLTTAVVVPLTLAAMTGPAGAARTGPTCSDVLHIEVHGHHVVADYVAGIGHSDLEWPPAGGVIGAAVRSNGGPALAGGPGAHGHLPAGIAPGASFCNGSRSPGIHL